MSGYRACACPQCFETAISSNDPDEIALCNDCEEAGCDGVDCCAIRDCQAVCQHESTYLNDRDQYVCRDCGEELGR